MGTTIKLPLTNEEKLKLRKAKLKMNELPTLSAEQIAHLLDIPIERARLYKGLVEFQRIPSIGVKLAEKLVFHLNLFSLEDMKEKDSAQLFDQLEQYFNLRIDPCVEDQIRCVIYYANNPQSSKQWFDFTDERKLYRNKYGYPENRPVK